MKILTIPTLNDLATAAKEFVESTKDIRRFAFYGKMGSGKTTFITSICHELGATDVISSPSFALINEYQTNSGEIIYHFDLYRIKTIEELYDIGYEDYFYSDSMLFIEWPELAEEILPDNMCKVQVEEIENSARRVTLFI